mgnify:CR=1 FL=1
MANALSSKELKSITDAVTKQVIASMNVEKQMTSTSVQQEMEYSDPVAAKLDEVEAQLVEQLANPVHKVIRGRRGATVIDVTAESIAQLQDLRKNRSKWRTQFNIK